MWKKIEEIESSLEMTRMDTTEPRRAQWSAANEHESVEVVSRFIAITTYTILEHRRILPSESFVWRDVGDGFERPILVPEEAGLLHLWMSESIPSAIAKRYLKSATIVVADDDEHALEQYTFRLKYPSSETIEVTATSASGAETTLRAHSISMFAQIKQIWNDFTLVASALPRLSDDAAIVTMKMSYTTIAPPGYQPPHFQSCSTDAFAFAASPPAPISIGEARGHSHSCKLVYQGPEFELNDSFTQNVAESALAYGKSSNGEQTFDEDADVEKEEEDDDVTCISAGTNTQLAYGDIDPARVPAKRQLDYKSLAPPKRHRQVCAETRVYVVSSQDSQDNASSHRRYANYAKTKEDISFTQASC